MRKFTTALLCSIAVLLCSCSALESSQGDETTSTTVPTTLTTQSPKWEEDDLEGDSEALQTRITLADNKTSVNGTGADVSGNVVTVSKAGVYQLSGSLSDGQICVDCPDKGTVQLILDGVSVKSQTTAPLFVKTCGKVILTLAADSHNVFADGDDFVYEDVENQEPSATVFSKSDLTINGDGSLEVTAVFNDGIVSRDGLKIVNGTIAVNAADDAVMGRDYVLVGGGDITLNADGDGLKSTNDNDESVGYVTMEGGKITVTSGKDGIQAKSALTIQGGELAVTAGGGSQNGTANTDFDYGWGQNSVDTSSDGKGLKAGTVLTIMGGTVRIDAADDALHSNRAIEINGGEIEAAAGDDGCHADESLTISSGTLTVTKSYEGLEAATITVNGGDVSVTASDDGVNASNGNSETSGDRGMQNMFASDGSKLYIHGGALYIDAKGDGLDSNGDVEMSGGKVCVIGPSNGANGTFDCNGSFNITGGTLVGIGSSGMAQAPTSNTMNSILWNGFTMYDADDLIVTTADGTVLVESEALRNASWLYVTCAELITGEDVTVQCGTQSKTFTIVEGGNTEGFVGGGFGGGFDMGRPGRPPEGFGR